METRSGGNLITFTVTRAIRLLAERNGGWIEIRCVRRKAERQEMPSNLRAEGSPKKV